MRTGSSDRDYAMYQKGVCQGLLRKHNEKQTTLKALLTETPDSRYAADAKFQLGETNIILENDGEALRYYTMVTQQHPNSPLVRQAMLRSALIHKRMGNVDQAIADFKAVVSKHRMVEGSRDALAGLKNIYIELGRVADYEAYIRTLEFIDPSTENLDEDYYQSAEKLYFEEKCPQAIGAFGDYLNKYPRGGYVLNAFYYRGDCHYRAGNYDQALPDLEEVIRRDGTQFMESALVGASDILFRQKRWRVRWNTSTSWGTGGQLPAEHTCCAGRSHALPARTRSNERSRHRSGEGGGQQQRHQRPEGRGEHPHGQGAC